MRKEGRIYVPMTFLHSSLPFILKKGKKEGREKIREVEKKMRKEGIYH